MLTPRSRLVLIFAAAVLPVVLGCGNGPPAPGAGAADAGKAPPEGSPEAAFVRVRDALRAQDFGAVHDMLSKDARGRAEAEAERTATSAAAMGPMARELLGFDPAEIGGLPAREKYVRVMKGTYETKASLESTFRPDGRDAGLAGGEFEGAETEGDRATVRFKLSCGATRAMALVREDGAWKLAEPLSARGEGTAGATERGPDGTDPGGAPKVSAETKADAPKTPDRR